MGAPPGPGPSVVTRRQGQQTAVPTTIGEIGDGADVVVAVQLAPEELGAQIEEHALDEQVDELVEKTILERRVAGDELDGAEDVALLLAHPGHQSLVRVHGQGLRRARPDLLPHAP